VKQTDTATSEIKRYSRKSQAKPSEKEEQRKLIYSKLGRHCESYKDTEQPNVKRSKRKRERERDT
jgi:hypothetical protein